LFISIFWAFFSWFNLLPQANRKGPAPYARPCWKIDFNPFFSFSFLEKDIFKRRFLDNRWGRWIIFYFHSTGLNWFRLGNIVCPVYRSFDYLIYPYYPAYHPFCYHFVISVDNREGELLRIIALLLYQNTTQFQDAFRKYDYLWETVNSE
jgi:hypothetical protein